MTDLVVASRVMLSQERLWFQNRLRQGLEKMEKIVSLFDGQSVAGVFDFSSLEGLLSSIGDVPSKVFRSLYSEKEWRELQGFGKRCCQGRHGSSASLTGKEEEGAF